MDKYGGRWKLVGEGACEEKTLDSAELGKVRRVLDLDLPWIDILGPPIPTNAWANMT